MAEHLHIYSVKNDPDTAKLLEVLESFEVPLTFYDHRDHPPEDGKLKAWAEEMGQDYPVRGRSTLWKKSERMFLRLEEADRYEWLRKHYHVLERPIIEDENGAILAMGGRPERLLKDLCNIRL
jgi:arsenate reductase-like glutaredoxin family protein